jgi:hypothetical protein
MRIVSTVLLSLFIVAGCSSRYVSSTLSSKWEAVDVSKITIVPFVSSPEVDSAGLRSGKVDPEGVVLITGMFLRGMEESGYTIIPFDDETKKMLSSDGLLPGDVVKSIGEKTGAGAVLTGVVTRYEEREGGPIGVRKPASVGFEVNLISTMDGTIIWHGQYAETQKSLSDDIGMFFIFLKRGGKWLTAEELARDGVKQVLKKLPGTPVMHPTPLY